MKVIKGDLIQLAYDSEFHVIVHGCNCFCTMGAGIAKFIKAKFPDAYNVDLQTKKGDRDKLGTISVAKITEPKPLFVVNAYTQFNWKGTGCKADYEAIRSCFKVIKAEFSQLRIGYPKIGAGLAGGDWSIISSIIDEELDGCDHTLVEFVP